jgi:hypothetical protein
MLPGLNQVSRGIIRSPHVVTGLALYGPLKVCVGGVTFHRFSDFGVGEILLIATALRRLNIGSTLMDDVFHRFANDDAKPITDIVVKASIGAERFFVKQGFEFTTSQSQWINRQFIKDRVFAAENSVDMHVDILSTPGLKTKIGMRAAKKLMNACTQRQLGFANVNNELFVRSGTGQSVRATVIDHPGHRIIVQYRNGATECLPAKYVFNL